MDGLFSCSRRGVLRAGALVGVFMLFGTTAVAQAQNGIEGKWSFAWVGASDNYSGILEVMSSGNGVTFGGRLTLRPAKGGTVLEDAQIAVSGDEVRIECANPTSADRDVSKWAPDRFYVKRTGDKMEGYSLDTEGRRGPSIVFTRM